MIPESRIDELLALAEKADAVAQAECYRSEASYYATNPNVLTKFNTDVDKAVSEFAELWGKKGTVPLAAALRQVREERDRYAKDAARYRWWRNKPRYISGHFEPHEVDCIIDEKIAEDEHYAGEDGLEY